MANLASNSVQSARSLDNDVDFGSVTLGAGDRSDLVAEAQESLNQSSTLRLTQDFAVRSFGSEPKDRSNDIDRDTGVQGPAHVLQFDRGAVYQSAPTELDASHQEAQPEAAGWNSRLSYSSAPEASVDDSVITIKFIRADGNVSVQRRAA